MSKKKLLGPDGKPLDVAKYRPAPPPPVTFTISTAAQDETHSYRFDMGRLISTMFVGSPRLTIGDYDVASPKPLRERVAADLAALHETLADMPPAPAEMPKPPSEVTDTYAVAFDSARRRCPHPNSVSTTHARRERQCMDCGRYFTRKEWYE